MSLGHSRMLFLTHLLALLVGSLAAWPGMRSAGSEEQATTELPSDPSRSALSPVQPVVEKYDSGDYAAAWEALQTLPLGSGERWKLQRELLDAWSIIDIQAALGASLRENRLSIASNFGGPEDTDCEAGIAAHPDPVRELIQQKAFGLETAVVRKEWLEVMWRENPSRIYQVLPGLEGRDRESVLGDIGQALASGWEKPEYRKEMLSRVLPLFGQPGGDADLRAVAAKLGDRLPAGDLNELRVGASEPAERFLYGSAFAIASARLDDEEFQVLWESLAPEDRATVARESLMADADGDGRTFEFAKLALAGGDLDALQAASAGDAFARFADNTEDPAGLVDWALTLPDEDRTRRLYRKAMEGAAVRDFAATRATLVALPEGWQKDHGIASLVYGGHYSDKDAALVGEVIESIADPGIRAAARDHLRRLEDE